MKQPVFSQNMVAWFNEGREIAFVRLYLSYQPAVTRAVRQTIRVPSDTDDLVSVIFIKIWEHFSGHSEPFKELKNIENFIDTITANTCRDYFRKKKVRQNKMDAVEKYYQDMEIYNQRTADTEQIFRDLINYVIGQFPKQRREIFLLYYLQNMKNVEIAKKLGISEKTVENHKNLAFKTLKMAYGGREGKGFRYSILLGCLICLDSLFK